MMISYALAPAAVVAVLLTVWEGYCRLSGVSFLVLPPPSAILTALITHRAELAAHALATAQVALVGFSLSICFAVLMSLPLHFAPQAERALLPLFMASQTIPLVALAPLMILWFGFGLLPKVMLVVLVTFFPMLLSLLSGYRQTPQAFVDLLTSMGAGRWRVFWCAKLPFARASFLAGLRISATYAIVATIFAEYAGARQGLGIYILAAKNNFRADLVLAAVVISAGLTLALLAALRLIAQATARGPEARQDA